MRKLLYLTAILIQFGLQAKAQVPDVIRTPATPSSGVNANNRSSIDANLAISKSFRIPRASAFTLNGAKDSIGYVMFNTTSNRIGVYRGGGVWDTYLITSDISGKANLSGGNSFGGLQQFTGGASFNGGFTYDFGTSMNNANLFKNGVNVLNQTEGDARWAPIISGGYVPYTGATQRLTTTHDILVQSGANGFQVSPGGANTGQRTYLTFSQLQFLQPNGNSGTLRNINGYNSALTFPNGDGVIARVSDLTSYVKATDLPLFTGYEYGVRGDTVTNNTVPLQNAINAASITLKKELWLQPGRYLITDTLNVPSNVKIYGTYNAVIYSPNNIAFFNFTGNNATVEGITIMGDTTKTNQKFFNAVGNVGLTIKKTGNKVTNNRMLNTKGIGVYSKWLLDDSTHVTLTVSNNRFDKVSTAVKYDDWSAYSNTYANMISRGDTAVYYRGGNQRFSDNTIANSKSIAVLVKGGVNNPNNGLSNFENNTINHNTKAFRIDSITRGGINIVNNQIHVSDLDSIMIDVSNSNGVVFIGGAVSAKSSTTIKTRWINNTNTGMINVELLDNLQSPIYVGERPVFTNIQYHGSGGAPSGTNFNWSNGNFSVKRAGASYVNSTANTIAISSYKASTGNGNKFAMWTSNNNIMDVETPIATGTGMGDVVWGGVSGNGTAKTEMARIRVTSGATTGVNIASVMDFYTSSNAGGIAVGMRLDSLKRLGVGGVTSPTAFLHTSAGTASISQLRTPVGPLLTTKIASSWGFLGDKIYYTIPTGTSEKELAIWDVTPMANLVPITVTNGRMGLSAVTNTELGYLSGATSGLQTQLNGKANLTANTFTGIQTINNVITTSFNAGVGFSLAPYASVSGRFVQMNNYSNGGGETGFFAGIGSAGTVGGFNFYGFNNAGAVSLLASMNGLTGAFTTLGPIAPGSVAVSANSSDLYAAYDNATRAFVSRTGDKMRSDLGVPGIVSPPTTSTSTGLTGTVAYDANYFYVCYGTNQWARFPKDITF